MNIKELQTAYRHVFASDDGDAVVDDLAVFAQMETKDPAVRAGRMDVIARILQYRRTQSPSSVQNEEEEE